MKKIAVALLFACGAPDIEPPGPSCSPPIDDGAAYPLTATFDAPGQLERSAPAAIDGGALVMKARVTLAGGVFVQLTPMLADCAGNYIGSGEPLNVEPSSSRNVAGGFNARGAAWVVLVAEPLGPAPLSATVEQLRVEVSP